MNGFDLTLKVVWKLGKIFAYELGGLPCCSWVKNPLQVTLFLIYSF